MERSVGRELTSFHVVAGRREEGAGCRRAEELARTLGAKWSRLRRKSPALLMHHASPLRREARSLSLVIAGKRGAAKRKWPLIALAAAKAARELTFATRKLLRRPAGELSGTPGKLPRRRRIELRELLVEKLFTLFRRQLMESFGQLALLELVYQIGAETGRRTAGRSFPSTAAVKRFTLKRSPLFIVSALWTSAKTFLAVLRAILDTLRGRRAPSGAGKCRAAGTSGETTGIAARAPGKFSWHASEFAGSGEALGWAARKSAMAAKPGEFFSAELFFQCAKLVKSPPRILLKPTEVLKSPLSGPKVAEAARAARLKSALGKLLEHSTGLFRRHAAVRRAKRNAFFHVPRIGAVGAALVVVFAPAGAAGCAHDFFYLRSRFKLLLLLFGNQSLVFRKTEAFLAVRRVFAIAAALYAAAAAGAAIAGCGRKLSRARQFFFWNQSLPLGKLKALILVAGLIAEISALLTAAAAGTRFACKFSRARGLFRRHKSVFLAKINALLLMRLIFAVGAARVRSFAAAGSLARGLLDQFGLLFVHKSMLLGKGNALRDVFRILAVLTALPLALASARARFSFFKLFLKLADPLHFFFFYQAICRGKIKAFVLVRRIFTVLLARPAAAPAGSWLERPIGFFAGHKALLCGVFHALGLVAGIIAVCPALLPSAAAGTVFCLYRSCFFNGLLICQPVLLGKRETRIAVGRVVAIRFARRAIRTPAEIRNGILYIKD